LGRFNLWPNPYFFRISGVSSPWKLYLFILWSWLRYFPDYKLYSDEGLNSAWVLPCFDYFPFTHCHLFHSLHSSWKRCAGYFGSTERLHVSLSPFTDNQMEEIRGSLQSEGSSLFGIILRRFSTSNLGGLYTLSILPPTI